ncbi:MAG: glutamate--tRNA ligase [Desulfurococcaceae archaeon]
MEAVKRAALKHALINAAKHGGRAETSAVVSKVLGEVAEARKLAREVVKVVDEIVKEVNKLSLDEQLNLLRKEFPEVVLEERREAERGLPPLPNAEKGKVVTRFAPNPDFAIHLGNARPALLSYWYAEMYDGKMILRFEDTDPRIKAPYPEAYEQIREDLRWLGIKWHEEYVDSLRMEIYYGVARELVERGGAYVDRCSVEEFRKYRAEGRACPHRELPRERQLEELDKMLEGHYGEGEAVLRVKTDLTHKDPSVRDWVALRIIDTGRTPHPVTGDKYHVWPTYNFAVAVDDHLMGITHVLRAKEHVSNTVKQKYVYDHMGWGYPTTIHFGRLSLEGFILSKSKMRSLMSEKGVSSFDDPRFGTIAGLRRRGIVPETIHRIVKEVGVKPTDAKISWANVSAVNRTIVDPKAPRYMAVEKPVALRLTGFDEEIEAAIPRSFAEARRHTYRLRPGDVVFVSKKDVEGAGSTPLRLLGLGNFVVERESATARLVGLDQEEARKAGMQIVQWVPKAHAVSSIMIVPKGLALIRKRLLVEDSLATERAGQIVQLYRLGFAVVDSPGRRPLLIFAHE